MHNNTKTTTFSVKKAYTYKTTRKQQTFSAKERSHMHNNTKTTTFGVKKGHTCTTTLKQQHLV